MKMSFHRATVACLLLFSLRPSECRSALREERQPQDALSQGQQEQHQLQTHRSLAGFLMPFQIQWRFSTAVQPGAPPEREPTEEEYQGIRQATEEFFTVEIPAFYASEDGFSFREIACMITNTEYDPSARFVHNIFHFCQATFDADSIEDLPTESQFLLDMNADYFLDNFVNNHLRTVDPQDPPSIFQFAGRIGYLTSNAGTTSPLPGDVATSPPVATPTSPPVATPAIPAPMPTMTMTTDPPAPAPTTGESPPPSVPAKKQPPPQKCGSIGLSAARGGAAGAAKDCESRRTSEINGGDGGTTGTRKRKLKGSFFK